MPIQHTLLYFSGASDKDGMGAKRLEAPHGQEVLTDMEGLTTPGDSTKIVCGFGGTLVKRSDVVQAAVDFLKKNHDSRGKLIIYGYSAGGINSLELCRTLQRLMQEVHLLVTVDISDRPPVTTILNPFATRPAVNRHVPANVRHARNYFQTDEGVTAGTTTASGPAIGRGVVNIPCDDLPFDNFLVSKGKSHHAQMQDLTRHKARHDMVIELNRT